MPLVGTESAGLATGLDRPCLSFDLSERPSPKAAEAKKTRPKDGQRPGVLREHEARRLIQVYLRTPRYRASASH